MNPKCKITYHAFDGTTFKTEEECIAHNQLPRIYTVEYISIYSVIKKAFVSEQDAINYCTECGDSYHVKSMTINLPKHRQQSVQSSITNNDTSSKWWNIFTKLQEEPNDKL